MYLLLLISQQSSIHDVDYNSPTFLIYVVSLYWTYLTTLVQCKTYTDVMIVCHPLYPSNRKLVFVVSREGTNDNPPWAIYQIFPNNTE